MQDAVKQLKAFPDTYNNYNYLWFKNITILGCKETSLKTFKNPILYSYLIPYKE